MSSRRTDVVNALASGGGAVLGVTFHLAGRLRPTAKPLHPRGRLVRATLTRPGLTPPSGVRWLDETGIDEVLVRVSRATGLPSPLPDIHGLAIRVPVAADRHADLLFATTGTGRLTRFVLRPALSAQDRPQTTLLPYRTPSGPALLAALPEAKHRLRLAFASGSGQWRPFGVLALSESDTGDADPTVSFDPMLHTIPGLEPYEWVRRLREGAYAEARRSRRRSA